MSVQLVSDNEFTSSVTAHSKVIVKYHADWCGSCKLFAPTYRRLSKDQRYRGVVFLDVNSEDNPLARSMAGVSNLPFFATFKDGQLLDGIATAKEDTVVAMLDRLST